MSVACVTSVDFLFFFADRLTKISAALDGLARNHALSRPVRRQHLILHFTPLQVLLKIDIVAYFVVCD